LIWEIGVAASAEAADISSAAMTVAVPNVPADGVALPPPMVRVLKMIGRI